MTTKVERLIKGARQEPSRDNLIEMWRHLFFLKAWYFMPNRTTEGPAEPVLIDGHDGNILPAFTSVRRLRDFCEATGRTNETDDVPLLGLSPLEAVDNTRQHREAIDTVVFNPDTEISVSCPTEALIKYADYFNLPDESELR